jgi:hypothetical protein
MPMRLLVSANRHFRNMCVHGAVGEHKHDVGAAGAAVAPAFQFDCGQVRNKIGFPHVVARSYRDEVALAGEVFLLAGAVAEIEIAAEHERLIVEGVHHHRQVCGTNKERPLAAAGVEVAVLGVERNGKKARGAPFEAAAAAIGQFELRRAVALQHVNDFFIEVPLRCSRFARCDVENKHVGEIAATLEMNGCAVDAIPWPGRGGDLEEINTVILRDRNAFAGEPFKIRIDTVARLCLRCLPDIHALLRFHFAVIINGGGSREQQRFDHDRDHTRRGDQFADIDVIQFV